MYVVNTFGFCVATLYWIMLFAFYVLGLTSIASVRSLEIIYGKAIDKGKNIKYYIYVDYIYIDLKKGAGVDLNDTELKIVIGMHRNVNGIDKKTSMIALEHGLTFSQFAVLEALYSKGDMTVGMVRKHILSTMGTIPLIIDNLVKMNYVQRRSDEKDRRVCIISLTDAGSEIIQKLAPINEKMIKEYMSILTDDEKDSLLYLMKKLGRKI